MTRWQKSVLGGVAISVGASGLLALAGRHDVAAYVTLPALIISAWAFVGHLVTVDDEAPGGWANPDGAADIWRQSLFWLAVKAVACAGIAGWTGWLWMEKG